MNSLADGGVLADAGLAVNILIAIGTIGAASVALWLGIHAQRTSTRQAQEARLKLTRQVICIYHPAKPGDLWSSIEIINASPEVVTRVLIHLMASRYATGDATQQPVWTWEVDRLATDFCNVHYLLPGASATIRGRFVEQKAPGETDPKTPDTEPAATIAVNNPDFDLMWEDSYGEVWNKRKGEQAFPTNWAAPWRDLRDRYPKWMQPAHWPPKPPMYRIPPLTVRLAQRAQRAKKHIPKIFRRSENTNP